MKHLVAFVYVLACLGTGCFPPPKPEPHLPPRDGGIEEKNIEIECTDMCTNLAELACGKTVGGGPHCKDTCITVLVNGAYPIPVKCYTRARTCDEARACKGGS